MAQSADRLTSRSLRPGYKALALMAWLAGIASAAESKRDTNGQAPTLQPRARIETSLGSFVVELNAELAPGSVLNFVQYAEDRFYEGTTFHRVIRDYTILGGSHTADLKEKKTGLRDPIRNEWRNGLKNLRGTLAVHRLGNKPDSGRTAFHINLVDNPFLDRPFDGAAYAVFGRVVEGMDVVDKIATTPLTADPKTPADLRRPVVPVDPVVIRSVRLLDTLDREQTKKRADSFDRIVEEIQEKAKTAPAEMIPDRIASIEREHNAKFTTLPSGLMVLDLEVGKGGTPAMYDTVVVHYVGTFADGTVFDDSRKNPDLGGLPWETPMTKLITGWVEALTTMKVGGKRIFVVPPQLAFGDRGRRNIPKNTTLFYEMELIGIK